MSIKREMRALRREVAELREALAAKPPVPLRGYTAPLQQPQMGQLIIGQNPNQTFWNRPQNDTVRMTAAEAPGGVGTIVYDGHVLGSQ